MHPPMTSPGHLSPREITDMPNATKLLERAREYSPADPEVAACWGLVMKGIEVGWIDQDELTQLVQHLRDCRDFGVDELLFAHVGDRIRVSFLDDRTTCSSDALVTALAHLCEPKNAA